MKAQTFTTSVRQTAADHQAADHSASPRQVAVGRMGKARPQRDLGLGVVAVLACNDAIDPQPQGTELTAGLVERRARGGEDLHIEDALRRRRRLP